MPKGVLSKKSSFRKATSSLARLGKNSPAEAPLTKFSLASTGFSLGAFFYRTKLAIVTVLSSIRTVAQEVLSSDELESEYFESVSTEHSHTPKMSHSPMASNTNVTLNVQIDNDEEDTLDMEPLRAKLEQNGPFIDGHKLWEKRRKVWVTPKANTPEGRFDPHKLRYQLRKRQIDLNNIPKDKHVQIYEILVENNKRLKNPMPLKDAVKLIDLGWVADKTWENATNSLHP
ncbi:hypothetical protein BABINDRAFT_5888 [Babjeviella inositovora NRRL Y-12698]|uniref:Gag1-like clamp domain-containing protein n=1 Tax=Babjeviella inositovora NRRL Y-12698 TaxID=984486 RepID=A0A1E3R0Y6_9ASCO|nr:uncharacterized protein BABINDRAFT_5888 [Babjeviella inositovora NRRL Y-12698]ODQ83012.1 hypothetical protein BABINDRAFT_5888 [Babjeviella inositovora NRRL Y-12698]